MEEVEEKNSGQSFSICFLKIKEASPLVGEASFYSYNCVR